MTSCSCSCRPAPGPHSCSCLISSISYSYRVQATATRVQATAVFVPRALSPEPSHSAELMELRVRQTEATLHSALSRSASQPPAIDDRAATGESVSPKWQCRGRRRGAGGGGGGAGENSYEKMKHELFTPDYGMHHRQGTRTGILWDSTVYHTHDHDHTRHTLSLSMTLSRGTGECGGVTSVIACGSCPTGHRTPAAEV